MTIGDTSLPERAYDVAIIGGGNLGLWTAHRLAARSFGTIAVLERGWAGGGATSRSAGVVRQQGGSYTAAVLGRLSRTLYLELGDRLGIDSGFREHGYYIMAQSEDDKDVFLELVKVRAEAGVDSEWIDPAEGKRRFGDLDWDLFTGATYCAQDGFVQPPIAARNITYAALDDPSVDLYEMCEVRSIEHSGNLYSLETTRGDIAAEHVVNAGGPRGAREVGTMVDIDVPVRAVRHQVVTFPFLPEGVTHPLPLMFNLGKGYYVRPEEEGALLGMSNPADESDHSDRYQLDYDFGYHNRLRDEWEAEFPALRNLPISRSWAASIDYTPDHLPIIDHPREGFYVVAAGGHGMMWGPALGEKTAELVAEGVVSELASGDIELARFSQEGSGGAADSIALPFPKGD
ncbi:MAG: FAD-binding oxidoreductase [Actinomycetota bacterium]|nr:FAD-binding oxidoreductase [Actinomycetota bacterium]